MSYHEYIRLATCVDHLQKRHEETYIMEEYEKFSIILSRIPSEGVEGQKQR